MYNKFKERVLSGLLTVAILLTSILPSMNVFATGLDVKGETQATPSASAPSVDGGAVVSLNQIEGVSIMVDEEDVLERATYNEDAKRYELVLAIGTPVLVTAHEGFTVAMFRKAADTGSSDAAEELFKAFEIESGYSYLVDISVDPLGTIAEAEGAKSVPVDWNPEVPVVDVRATGGYGYITLEIPDGRKMSTGSHLSTIQVAGERGCEVKVTLEGNPISISLNGEVIDSLTSFTLDQDTVLDVAFAPTKTRSLGDFRDSIGISYVGDASIAGGYDTTSLFMVTDWGALAAYTPEIVGATHGYGDNFSGYLVCANHRYARPDAGTYPVSYTFVGSEDGWDYYDIFVESGDATGQGPLWPEAAPYGTQNVLGKIRLAQQKGELALQKRSSNADLTDGNPLYSLEGAQYGIYTNSDATGHIATFTTDVNGNSETIELEKGTYYVKEIQASLGYLLDETIYSVEVTSGQKTFVNEANGGIVLEKPKNDPSLLVLRKQDVDGHQYDALNEYPQGGAELGGAQYTLKYYASETATGTPTRQWVYQTNNTGFVSFRDLNQLVSGDSLYTQDGMITWPLGTITVQETKAPTGYVIDPTIFIGHIKEDANSPEGATFVWEDGTNSAQVQYNQLDGTITHWEDSIKGGIQIEKQDKESGSVQGGASLEGISFEIRSINESAVIVDGNLFSKGDVVKTITTSYETQNGVKKAVARTGSEDLPYGRYEIKESSTNGSYRLTDGIARVFEITEHGAFVTKTIDGADLLFANEVVRGGVKIEKQDGELVSSQYIAQGDASLEGISFEIRNLNENAVIVDGERFTQGNVVKTITTSYVTQDGVQKAVAQTGANDLPYGRYEIQESATNGSYRLTDGAPRTFEITEHGAFVTGTINGDSLLFANKVRRGGVQIQKWDKELDKSESLSDKNGLAGIEFVITNESLQGVIVDSILYQPGEAIMKIYTAWNADVNAYTAQTSLAALPYGTYGIKESATNYSYLLTDSETRIFEIREDEKMVTVDKSGKDLVFKNQVVRGDFQLAKILEGGRRLSVPFVITNLATNEQHVIVTDRNGEFSSESSWNLHSTGTNGNDHLLQMESDGVSITATDMDDTAGIWFGTGEFGTVADVNDALAALPIGQYNIREIPTEYTQNITMVDFDFEIYRNNRVVDLETIINVPNAPHIDTTAWSLETKEQLSSAEGMITIVDTTHAEGLVVGGSYTLKGVLTNQLIEGSPIMVNGRAIRGEVTFVAEKTNMDIEMVFTFDATDLDGMTIMPFQKLYYQGQEVAGHEDPDAESQMIHIPAVKTKAIDESTGQHVGSLSETMTFTDTVTYSNLLPGKEYTVTGTLMNQATNEPILVDGEPILSSTTFVAEEANGSVEVTFVIDSTILAGTTIVVFEDLYYNGIKIATHSDISDEDQSIYIPEIGTSLVDGETGIHLVQNKEEVVLTDTIEYHNVIPGLEYEMTGWLMSKETNEPLEVNGEKITGTVVFTPEESSGTIEVTFVFDGSELAGVTVVAFEELYLDGVLVAEHKDIDDEGQTVHIPEIGTLAYNSEYEIGSEDSKLIKATKEAQITDQIAYANFEVGREYTVTGTPILKSTGEPLKDKDGNVATGTLTFTPTETDGKVEVNIIADTSNLKDGDEIVMFEEITTKDKDGNNVLIAEHKDINDKAQTITVRAATDNPKSVDRPKTSVSNPNTGLSSNMGTYVVLLALLILTSIMTVVVYLIRKKRQA